MDKLKLVIVDDDPEVSEFVGFRLSMDSPHFEITRVGSARECLEHMKDNEVDCILSDYQMPDMDGMELLKTLRGKGETTPFIFLTGQGNEELAREAFKNGASDYFTKEISFAHYARITNSVEQAVKSRALKATQSQAEEALTEANSTLRAIFEASPLGIFVLDEDGIVRMWNKTCERMFGWSGQETVGRFYPLVPPEKIDEHLALRKRVFGGEIITDLELHRRKKDGAPVDISLSTAPILGSDGNIKQIFNFVTDITERKRTEKERSAVFHMLTHDIKGPLSVIYGFDESSVKDPDMAGRIMSDIKKAAKRISVLIDDMLSLSGLESNKAGLRIGPVSLPELVAQALNDNAHLAEKKDVAIKTVFGPSVPVIYADGAQIGRAVGNLISNAVNYTGKGGRITVKAGVPADKGGCVFVEVADNGEGIGDDEIRQIFEKYYRGKASAGRRGAGLGLAIVKAAVEAHGGSVSVKSRKGKGSTFTVVLPVKPGMGWS